MPDKPRPEMNDHELERRPAPGSPIARAEDFAVARRAFERAKAEHVARQCARRPGGLTLAEARRRMHKAMGGRVQP